MYCSFWRSLRHLCLLVLCVSMGVIAVVVTTRLFVPPHVPSPCLVLHCPAFVRCLRSHCSSRRLASRRFIAPSCISRTRRILKGCHCIRVSLPSHASASLFFVVLSRVPLRGRVGINGHGVSCTPLKCLVCHCLYLSRCYPTLRYAVRHSSSPLMLLVSDTLRYLVLYSSRCYPTLRRSLSSQHQACTVPIKRTSWVSWLPSTSVPARGSVASADC
ncbi:hypothetical protein SCLCIDRAFT_779346 [Scleroderma citrinum Foug A]|uniref:Uncharacterized protein n=1 Tax=Scleroderma citrinum Foug A TaxID=1036808 RepID=A0A0C3DQE8_9AGAM|nr:hypothetical protein SCLCIDRAFT_779346 [Scleroderma citrinum Foug A]